MNTKNIFKALAAAMLMPAMLLTTACSSQDDDIVNNSENTANKGYELPVTVNVTRQGDNAGTRATYTYDNTTEKGTLAFSEGDKLFVTGNDNSAGGAGKFAGTLDYDATSGNFSGRIYIQNAYSGTYDALFTVGSAQAYLLPDGYGGYNFLSIDDKGTADVYDDDMDRVWTEAFALTKAAAVEQLSYEYAYYTSGTGFELEPNNAILFFTLTDLEGNTDVTVKFRSTREIEKTVTTDDSGNATFAVAVTYNTDFEDCGLTVDGNAITLLASGSKTLSAGKIYNVTRSGLPTVTWDSSNCSDLALAAEDDEETIDGITLTNNSDANMVYWDTDASGICFETGGFGGFRFTAPVGKYFKRIVMTVSGDGDGWKDAPLGSWDYNSTSKTVTWESEGDDDYGVSLLDGLYDFSGGSAVTSIVFTLRNQE